MYAERRACLLGAPVRCLVDADASIANIPNPPGFLSAIDWVWLSPAEQTVLCHPTPASEPMNVRMPGPAHLVFDCIPRAQPSEGPLLVRVAQGRIVHLARGR